MNYFGLFFSFMVPGMIIGIMAAVAVRQEAAARARRVARARKPASAPTAVSRDRLFIHDLGKAA